MGGLCCWRVRAFLTHLVVASDVLAALPEGARTTRALATLAQAAALARDGDAMLEAGN